MSSYMRTAALPQGTPSLPAKQQRAEDKLMDEMQSWFTDPIVEKVELN
ncbi:MAG: hypothetical protein IJQ02_14040 [Oscillospiraceae bacterium]|nr:hypothetical protein [Oscillospiraceae bacterium]